MAKDLTVTVTKDNKGEAMLPVLIIFSRFPEPGKSKTRMIPALGALGAAQLHEEMTRHTLRTANELARNYPVSVEVHVAGGDVESMRQVFGCGLSYQAQVEGDLGQKMYAALAAAFGQGANRAIVIGADCPNLTPVILRQAFDALESEELVLGPAQDGGYYLIGSRRVWPQLFTSIPWGSQQVFARTLLAAHGAGLNPHILETLPDVDRPEDLPIWEAARHR